MNIAFPWRIGPSGGTALAGPEHHVRDMIEQLLFTTPGERVNRPDLGGGLSQLVFAPNSLELAAALQISIQAGLQRYLGDLIEIQSVQVTSEDATTSIAIDYRLRADGSQAQAQLQLAAGAGA